MNKVHSVVSFSTIIELKAHIMDLDDEAKVLCCGDDNVYLVEFEDGTIMFEYNEDTIEEITNEMLGDDLDE